MLVPPRDECGNGQEEHAEGHEALLAVLEHTGTDTQDFDEAVEKLGSAKSPAERVEAGLRCEFRLLVAVAEDAEQPPHLGECLAAGALDRLEGGALALLLRSVSDELAASPRRRPSKGGRRDGREIKESLPSRLYGRQMAGGLDAGNVVAWSRRPADRNR